VRAKAQRLSEWENMTDKQKTAVSELEKLKKALTMQVSRYDDSNSNSNSTPQATPTAAAERVVVMR